MTDTQIALVTGANKGIGREIAARLAERGMTVLLAARDPDKGAKAASAMATARADVRSVKLDVTDPAIVTALAEWIAGELGRLDILVNNAGVSGGALDALPGATAMDAIRAVFETNLFGVIAVTDAMLPLLKRSNEARIVNVSSGTASLSNMTDPDHYMSGMPASVAYPTSKTALNALTVQYAKQLRGDGILVNAAAPGACATDFAKDLNLNLTRTAAQGAAIAVRLATLSADGPTGGFYDDDGTVPW